MPAALTPAPAPQTRNTLFKALASQRPMSPEATENAPKLSKASDGFVFVDRTWVTLWYDTGNVVHSQCGGMTAYRAITTTGDLLWYVAPEGKGPVYHAQCADPFQAIEHATVALGAQNDLKSRWVFIECLARELRQGTLAFHITAQDVHNSPVAPLALRALMAGATKMGTARISGRSAAILMRVAPNVGFVLHTAWLRCQTHTVAPRVAAPRAPAVSFEAIC